MVDQGSSSQTLPAAPEQWRRQGTGKNGNILTFLRKQVYNSAALKKNGRRDRRIMKDLFFRFPKQVRR